MKTIIIGLGNSMLKDDGVGVHVAKKVRELTCEAENVEVIELSSGGLRLAEAMADYDRAIIIDAAIMGGKPGKIYRLKIDEINLCLNTSLPHNLSLISAIEIGEKLGINLPSEIVIYGIQIADISNFGEDMTEAVKSAIPVVIEEVLKELNKINEQSVSP